MPNDIGYDDAEENRGPGRPWSELSGVVGAERPPVPSSECTFQQPDGNYGIFMAAAASANGVTNRHQIFYRRPPAEGLLRGSPVISLTNDSPGLQMKPDSFPSVDSRFPIGHSSSAVRHLCPF